MNIFEEELRRLFEDGMVLDSPVFSGQLCMAMVGTDCHVQIQFVPDADRDKYDTLQIIAVKQMNGYVDAFRLKLSDVLKAVDSPEKAAETPKHKGEEKIVPHILLRNDTAAWFPAPPSRAERDLLLQEAGKYLDRFRSPGERLFGRPRLVYLSVPIRDGREEDLAYARQIAEETLASGNIPVCPRLLFPQVFAGSKSDKDGAAQAMLLRLVDACQQLNVYASPWTSETWLEVRHAKSVGIPVRTYGDHEPLTTALTHPKRQPESDVGAAEEQSDSVSSGDKAQRPSQNGKVHVGERKAFR